MYRPAVPYTPSSPPIGNSNSDPVWGVVRPTPAMDNLQQQQRHNHHHHGEDSTTLDLVEAQRRAARLYTRSNTAFMCSSIFNVLAIAFFTGGVFAAQLSFLVEEEDSSGDVVIDEVDVYFYHAVATYGTVVITSDLPDCLSGLYIGGFVAGLTGVILCLLAMVVGVVLRYKNILTAARFVRPMALCLSCCCAVISAAISRAGTNTCNGDLEGYDMGTGIKLLFCTVVLVAVAAVIALVRECKCPVLPDASTTSASTLLLGQDMQQMHIAAAVPPSPHHQHHFPPPLLLPQQQQQQTSQQLHRTAGTSSSSYQQQHRQHQTPTSSPAQRPAQPPPFQLQGDDDDEPAQYTPALSPSSPPYESNDDGVYDNNAL